MDTVNPYAAPVASFETSPLAEGPRHILANRDGRLIAAFVDGFAMILLIWAPMLMITIGRRHDAANPMTGLWIFGTLAGFVIWAGLNLHFLSQNGQSIGKKLLGIKIVRPDGSPASVLRIVLLRGLLNTALGFIPLYGLADSLAIFGSHQRCIHDWIADTIVIRAQPVVRFDDVG